MLFSNVDGIPSFTGRIRSASGHRNFDIMKRLSIASNKGLKGDFGSQKHTFKRKKLGFQAKGRKARYSDSHPKDENIVYLKNRDKSLTGQLI